MNLPIVFENEKFLVVNKPFGVVVNRAESIKGETVQDWVEEQGWFKKLKNYPIESMILGKDGTKNQNNENSVYWQRSGVCHRLDKETSGCLLIAKNPVTLRYFLGLFKDRKITKRYKALVHGNVEPSFGEVVLPIKRSIIEREKWRVYYDGKKAVTMWSVLNVYNFNSENQQWKNKLTLLDVGLKTGRTHQIRVHLSFLGWPIFADDKYLNSKQRKVDRDYLLHHFLHSAFLGFKDEVGNLVEVESPLPEECLALLQRLELSA